MANDTSGSIWNLDTDGVIKTFDQRVKILKMLWEPAAAADTLSVQDGNGAATIWNRTALAPGGSGGDEEWNAPGKGITVNGFKVTFSDSAGTGTLYVHVG